MAGDGKDTLGDGGAKASEVIAWMGDDTPRGMTAIELDSRYGSSDQLHDGAEDQGLLSGEQKSAESAGKGDDPERQHFKPRSKFSSGCHLMVGALSVIVLILLGIALLWVHVDYQKDGGNLAATKEQQPAGDRYLLDPAWDFAETPKHRTFDFTLKDEILNPDGVFRPMMTINGEFPGPLIEANDGDTLFIHVHNRLVNATSIHWHGLFQNGSNHMDGTVGITQCPIAPGADFTYEFKLSGQSGTYFYHAHQGVQASDGIIGPLVIHSPDERRLQKVDYDTDRVIMISDHYHDTTSALLETYLASDRENVEPVPDGALINGHNVRNCDLLRHRSCDNSTAQRPLFNLASNQKHRFRFINTGALAEFQIQIDEHEFAVTEVDGTDVLPAYYHRLNIAPAQRYSIILSPDPKASSSFWLRARMITHCFGEENPDQEPEIWAVINYNNEAAQSVVEPTSKDWPEAIEVLCKDMNTTELVPALPIAAPAKADHFFYLRSSFRIGAWRLSRGFFNTTTWRPDAYSPTLSRAISGLAAGNESFTLPADSNGASVNDRGFSLDRELVIQTTGIQTIDLLMQNFDDGNHPMHLHGYKYFVLASGHGGFEPDEVYSTVNLSNPLRRDTATIESYGWLLIRLVANNPGMWALHCHISWHSEAGLVMQLLTRADVVAGWEEPEANQALCRADGLEKGMVPPDEHFYGDEDDDQ